MLSPIALTADDHQRASHHFNWTLFEGQVPPSVLTLSKNRRYKRFFLHVPFLYRVDGRRQDEIGMIPQVQLGALHPNGPGGDHERP